MGRSRKPKEPTMESCVPSNLSDTQLNDRGRLLARKRVEVLALKRRRKLITSEIDGDIKGLESEMDLAAQQMVDGFEMLAQGDLFVKVSSMPGPDPGPEPAPDPLPSEAHQYRPPDHLEDDDSAACWPCELCGGEAGDPVHVTTPAEAEEAAELTAQQIAETTADVASYVDAVNAETRRQYPPEDVGAKSGLRFTATPKPEFGDTPPFPPRGSQPHWAPDPGPDPEPCACNPDAGTFCDGHMPTSMRRRREREKALAELEADIGARSAAAAPPAPVADEGDVAWLKGGN